MRFCFVITFICNIGILTVQVFSVLSAQEWSVHQSITYENGSLFLQNTENASAGTSFSQRVQALKRQLKHKFVVDYLIHATDESGNPLIDSSWLSSPEDFHWTYQAKLPPGVLEQFTLGVTYNIYQIRSIRSNTMYILVSDTGVGEGPGGFDLFEGNDSNWAHLDSFDFGGHGGRVKFRRLNGQDVITVDRPTWSSGFQAHFAIDEAIIAIDSGKFKTLFGTRSLELLSPPADSDELTLYTTRTISLKDLNGDGFLDIVEKERVVKAITVEHSSLYDVKVKSGGLVSKTERKYTWNQKTYSFDRTY